MLGFLSGRIISKNLDTLQVVVLSHRVGYEVSVPRHLFDSLLEGETTSVWIHTHVREDNIQLFGFATDAEKKFFRILLGVSGLGPKTAVSLLAEHGPDKLPELILNKDASGISSAPGVGKKLAEKIILELSGKLEKLTWLKQLERPKTGTSTLTRPAHLQLKDDLSSALTHLGYQPAHIKSTLDKLFDEAQTLSMGFEAILRQALQEMSGRPLTKPSSLKPQVSEHG